MQLANNTIWMQVIIGALFILFQSGLLIYTLRAMKAQIDCKADKTLCNERHTRINEDLARGREEFKELHEDIKAMTTAQSKTNEHLVEIRQQIDFYVKQNGGRGP